MSMRQGPVRAVLLDIEGTIAAQSFVTEVLFAYSRPRLRAFIAAHAGEAEVAAILIKAGRLADGADPIAALEDWHERDVKAPPLKRLQGMIWSGGFRSGELKSHFYDDAVAALRRWHQAGIPLYIYSSGSIEAQRLYFEFSTFGDLRPLLSGYFDTSIGAKVEAASYGRIATAIGIEPTAILFFSDNVRELEAAATAGIAVRQAVRAKTQPDPRFVAVTTFDGIAIAAS